MYFCTMKNRKEIIKGSNDRDILIDITFPLKSNNKLIVFSHGFKGFKDWGCFSLMSKIFAQNGFTFLKFNFSHNGTTINNPLFFDDLESFGNNNFSIELNDLSLVVDWSLQNLNIFDITLLGHSRGGSISLIKSEQDIRIKRVVSWASPSDLLSRIDNDRLELWREKGVLFVYNGRTKQNMPLYFQFYNDCQRNRERLDIKTSVSNLKIPQLIIHGDSDSSVDVKESYNLHKWNPNSELFIVKEANHVFGSYHPFLLDKLPSDLQIVVDKTIAFIL